MAFDDWSRLGGFPPPSRPRKTSGGIKAASQRGGFGDSWWARRWIDVLESFDSDGRLRRGRAYARKGQVLSINVTKGMVEAPVQGSRAQPYRVTITVRQLLLSEWKQLATQLSKQAIYAAKLLAGEMPREIEKAFSEAGLSLFPEKLKEISTSCSCPDWSNPCKHVAAVYYLLGEAFDRDPFLIFRLRGMDREEFISMLGADIRIDEPAAIPEAEPLPIDPQDFWSANVEAEPVSFLDDVIPKSALAALPRTLGAIQFWRGEIPLIKALEPSYQNAVREADQLLLGEK